MHWPRDRQSVVRLRRRFFYRGVQGLIASAAGCATLCQLGELQREDVELFLRVAQDTSDFGVMARLLVERNPNAMDILESLSQRKGLIVARLLGFLRVVLCRRTAHGKIKDDFNLYCRLLFRGAVASDTYEDIAPLALVARAICFSEVYLTHQLLPNLREVVGIDGVAGMCLIYAKLGSCPRHRGRLSSSAVHSAPVDVFPIQASGANNLTSRPLGFSSAVDLILLSTSPSPPLALPPALSPPPPLFSSTPLHSTASATAGS